MTLAIGERVSLPGGRKGRVVMIGPRTERIGRIRRAIRADDRLYLVSIDGCNGAEWVRLDQLKRITRERQHGSGRDGSSFDECGAG